MMRMEGRSKQKSQRKDRKSAAAQNRMKTIANLAAEDKVIPNKKRKKGDGESPFLRNIEVVEFQLTSGKTMMASVKAMLIGLYIEKL